MESQPALTFGGIIVVGVSEENAKATAIVVPSRSVEGFRLLDAPAWQSWLQVDVLQCIGFTLAFIQLLTMVVRARALFAAVATGLCVCVVLLTPTIWEIEWTKHLSLGIAAYLSSKTGSLFPLFPWSGYILFGTALASFTRDNGVPVDSKS